MYDQLKQLTLHRGFTALTCRYTVRWHRPPTRGVTDNYRLQIITKTNDFRWWNLLDDMFRMGRWNRKAV